MMRSGIIRLQEGGIGIPWYMSIFGTRGSGETEAERARREYLEKLFETYGLAVPAGQANYDPFAGEELSDLETDLKFIMDLFDLSDTETGGTETGDTQTGDTQTGDTQTGDTQTGDTETGGTETGGTETDDGSNRGGLFGLGIGPFLSDLFGATGTGWGNVLSGIFGQGGNIKDLIDLFLKGKMVKGAWDAIEYEVPTGQKESMSDFEKANPLTTNMTLAGIRPNYLQNQKYAIPVGQSGIPAATHTVGTPFVEKVEEVQGGEMGGIMGAKGHGDIVPALLEPNEFVFTRKAVQNMGNGNVNLGAKRMYKIMKDLERMG
jgi:hypothetical protein